jgi:hypothetical protein
MHWLGRLSARFNLCDELKEQAWAEAKEAWVELGPLAQTPTPKSATYQVQTFEVTFADGPARAFVYHSLSLDRKKSTRCNVKLNENASGWRAFKKR